jgi:RimJ/RimL family protein N-acetyltransferase
MAVRLETERLLLREWRDGDWVGLHRAYGDPDVMRWLGDGEVSTLEQTAFAVGRMHGHWQQLGYGMFAAEERATGELIGRIGLMRHPTWPIGDEKVEVGWTLQRSAWGKGFATEGAKASLTYAFERIGLRRVFSMTDPANARSRAVMERCALTLRGEIDFGGYHEGWYAIEREAWPPDGLDPRSILILDG